MPAPWAYFDTSVLVKRYVREQGSARARALLRRYRFLSSALAPAEALSALTRRRAAGDVDEQDSVAILNRMHKDRAYWTFVEVTPLVLSRAEELMVKTALRTLDAIHVASAMTFQATLGTAIPFITGDARQREVADQSAMDVVWVE